MKKLFDRQLKYSTGKFLLSFLALLLINSPNLFSQDAEAVARQFIGETAAKYDLSAEDIKEWMITSEHVSSTSQVHHIYCRQTVDGIGALGADLSLHVTKSGDLLVDHNAFVKDLNGKVRGNSESLKVEDAIDAAFRDLGYTTEQSIKVLESPKGNNKKQVLSDGGVSLDKIHAQLVYHSSDRNGYNLAWELYVVDPNGRDVWMVYTDAADGKILEKANLTLECGTGGACSNAAHDHDDHSHESPSIGITLSNTVGNLASLASGNTYGVYAVPLESPYYGAQTTVCDPADASASPNGWHDMDGAPGADTYMTQGNNVFAYVGGGTNAGYSPNGGLGLDFVFPHDPLDPNPNLFVDASMTNLFYINNVLHDMISHYGFDEASGNFQNHNYTGLGVSTDFVKARGMTSTWCNATMATPVDGVSPTLSMYICSSGGLKDGNFDNLVIGHEYGHGISKRLVGGAGNTSVITNQEQMGEGWSDYYGLMLSMSASDVATDQRGVGTWLFNQGAGGPGIRTYRYTTDMAVNPHTYLDIAGESAPHGVGSVWCAMIWGMTWGLIDEYGFDADIYNGTGGNNIALNLVTEALKLTPTVPGFEDGRDAILAADVALYGGANRCIIWKAFAKRGMGVSADQGLATSKYDGSEAFDIPADCDCAPDFQTKILASDDQANDQFGTDVSINGSWAVTGAPYEDAAGSNAGAVYVYKRSGNNTWNQVQKITAPDAAANDQFGRSVDLGRGFLIIGAPYDDDNGSNSGSAYIYKYDSGSGTYVYYQKITAWDGAANDYFGYSVSMYSRVALVGAIGDDDNGSSSGSAYSYRFTGSFWNGWQKFTASDGAAGDSYGFSVDVWGSNMIIGANGDDDSGNSSGSAYILNQAFFGGNYAQVQKLLASDGAEYDYFGRSVSIYRGNAVVGAFQRLNTKGGKAYVFTNTPSTVIWPEAQILIPDDNAPGDNFGWDVAIYDEEIVVGARGDDDNGINSGSVYRYTLFASYWCQSNKLTANDGAAYDYFGTSVANAYEYTMVGAPSNDDGGSNSGSAYIFHCETDGPLNEEPDRREAAKVDVEPFDVQLSPNPNAGDVVQLSLSGLALDTEELQVKIFDMQGRIVHQSTISSGENSSLVFDQPLAKGFYMVTVQMAEQQVVKKLVID